jgi:uncharacterized protein (TIGR00730 family)
MNIINRNNKQNINQTLTESEFSLLKIIEEEYIQGFLALNSLGPFTITFYGGHMVNQNDSSYIGVYNIAKDFASRGWGVVSGGGPGIMEAALKGSMEVKGKAIAFKIDIKNESSTLNADLTLTFTQFSVRKFLLRQSDAFVFAPGGFGTLDELMELLTLIKTEKYPKKPIFLYDSKFWSGYLKWFKEVLLNEHNTINEDFMKLFHVVDSHLEIVKIMFEQDS